jgi:hypothetical protein
MDRLGIRSKDVRHVPFGIRLVLLCCSALHAAPRRAVQPVKLHAPQIQVVQSTVGMGDPSVGARINLLRVAQPARVVGRSNIWLLVPTEEAAVHLVHVESVPTPPRATACFKVALLAAVL